MSRKAIQPVYWIDNGFCSILSHSTLRKQAYYRATKASDGSVRWCAFVQVQALEWGLVTTQLLLLASSPPELLIGSDCLYEPRGAWLL